MSPGNRRLGNGSRVRRGAVVATLVCLAAATPALAQANLRELAAARIPLVRAISGDPVVMAALRAKNASGESFQDIRRKDAEWSQNPQAPLRKELTSNNCATRLRELTKSDPAVVEVILMDRNGANVCISRETSDYWQGDEEKFQKPYQEGHDIFMGEAAFDQSAGVYALQVSALVWDGDAKAGALTLSLRVKRQELKGR
jgi:hypothetical protein